MRSHFSDTVTYCISSNKLHAAIFFQAQLLVVSCSRGSQLNEGAPYLFELGGVLLGVPLPRACNTEMSTQWASPIMLK